MRYTVLISSVWYCDQDKLHSDCCQGSLKNSFISFIFFCLLALRKCLTQMFVVIKLRKSLIWPPNCLNDLHESQFSRTYCLCAPVSNPGLYGVSPFVNSFNFTEFCLAQSYVKKVQKKKETKRGNHKKLNLQFF